jgi:hypothetical protein
MARIVLRRLDPLAAPLLMERQGFRQNFASVRSSSSASTAADSIAIEAPIPAVGRKPQALSPRSATLSPSPASSRRSAAVCSPIAAAPAEQRREGQPADTRSDDHHAHIDSPLCRLGQR